MSKNKKNAPLEEEEALIYEFQDEDGNVIKFEFLDTIEFEGKDYAVLLPVTENEDEAVMVHIFEIVEELDSEYDSYLGIDDQELVDKIYAAFMTKHKDSFNFID